MVLSGCADSLYEIKSLVIFAMEILKEIPGKNLITNPKSTAKKTCEVNASENFRILSTYKTDNPTSFPIYKITQSNKSNENIVFYTQIVIIVILLHLLHSCITQRKVKVARRSHVAVTNTMKTTTTK